jgi:hypothetical protein
MMGIIIETDDHLAMSGGALAASTKDECREEPRIHGPFPARIKGLKRGGKRLVFDTVIENLSARDCCVCLVERVEPGERLFIAARIDKAIVSLRGKVLHTSLRADGMWGVFVLFTRYRFVHRRKNSD